MKLPDIRAGMSLDQAMLIELLSILVGEGIITEAKAVDRYLDRKQQFSTRTGAFGNWDIYDDNLGMDGLAETKKQTFIERVSEWIRR